MVATRSSTAKSQPQFTRVLRSSKAPCPSPTKASARNGTKKPRAKVIRKRKITSGSEFKYLLDLPYEIRHQIYSYFVQRTESSDPRNVKAISKSRKSLLSVCHQVHREFSPLFYRHCTIIVHAIHPVRSSPDHRVSYNATEFGNLFLSSLATYKIQNIRRLSYNVHDTSLPRPRLLLSYRNQMPWVDWTGLNSLAMVLHTFDDSLNSLEELVVYINPGWWYSSFSAILWAMKDLRDNRSGGQGETWIETENKLVGPEGPLQGWDVSRSVGLRRRGMPDENFWQLLYFSSTFRKRHVAQTPQALVPTRFEVSQWPEVPETDLELYTGVWY